MKKSNRNIDEEILVEEKEKNEQDQVNNQHNRQDLDQEQNVYTNPLQFNNQNITVIIDNDYSGKIMGTTFLEGTNKVMSDVEITLFPGDSSLKPICKTISDKSGNYEIKELPPGYYTLIASLAKLYQYKSQYIKVMVGQNVFHNITLKRMSYNNDLESRKQKFYSNTY